MDFTIITPEIFSKIFENSILIGFIIILFIFINNIYKIYVQSKEKIELTRLDQLKKDNEEKYKREDEHREMSRQMTKALHESIEISRLLREEIKERENIIEDMNRKNKEHRFKIIKHVTNAQNETEVILQCPNCKKNGEVVIDELYEIKNTAQRSIINE